MIDEIKNFRINGCDIEEHFKFVFPLHIGCTHWKYDYIAMKRKRKL